MLARHGISDPTPFRMKTTAVASSTNSVKQECDFGEIDRTFNVFERKTAGGFGGGRGFWYLKCFLVNFN